LSRKAGWNRLSTQPNEGSPVVVSDFKKEIAMSNQNQNPGQQNQNPGQKPGQQQGGGQKPGQQQQDPNRQGQKPGQQGEQDRDR
jgi:hypothetical protein